MQSSDFELLDVLGEGAAAVTYEAKDGQGNIVCVKRFKTGLSKKDQKELLREISMLQTLRHPRIPKFYGSYVQEVEGRELVHLVMEKIEGQNLREWLKLNRPHQTEVLEILLSLLDILVYLHEIQPPVIHRDIKTSNVIRSSDGSIFLIDFGQATDAIDKTYGHTLVTGTLGYQAPEQIIGQPTVKSDVYSLGAIAVELLTGINPHEMLEGQRLRWERKCSHLSRPLFDWLDKMLEMDGGSRYSATEAKRVLYQLSLAFRDGVSPRNFEPVNQAQVDFNDMLSEAVRDHEIAQQKEEDRQYRASVEEELQQEQEKQLDMQEEVLFADMVKAWDKMVELVAENKLKKERGLSVFYQSFSGQITPRTWRKSSSEIVILISFAHDPTEWDEYADWLERREWEEGSYIQLERELFDQEKALLLAVNAIKNLGWFEGFFKRSGLEQKAADELEKLDTIKENLKVVEEKIKTHKKLINKNKSKKKQKKKNRAKNEIVQLEMVRIKRGSFIMGALRKDKNAEDNEKPRHEVKLTRDFYMGRYPITQSIWNEIMNDDKDSGGPNHPVSDLSWYDCIEFCNRLSKKEGRKPVYTIKGKKKLDKSVSDVIGDSFDEFIAKGDVFCDWDADGYRLPTEAEWEYAARGGEYKLYAGSNDIDDVGWHIESESNDDSFYDIRAVGLKKPNDFGLYDMSGNVWEWCWDCIGEYSSKDQIDPRGLEPDNSVNGIIQWSERVMRGGSFDCERTELRVSRRHSSMHVFESYGTGLRVVRAY